MSWIWILMILEEVLMVLGLLVHTLADPNFVFGIGSGAALIVTELVFYALSVYST
jgi:hypothetical protein